jgi:heme/copper-type cytochrome/quinol oxidase subunit 4
MVAFLRLMFILMVVLTIVYVALSLYSRSVRRGKLEAHWDRKGMTGDREAFVQRGLKKYDGSFRRKLILGVYVVPLTMIAILVYVTNYM